MDNCRLHWNVKRSLEVCADMPAGLVTVISTVPGEALGLITVSDVVDKTVTLEPWSEPKATETPATKPDPLIVTCVPPAAGPEFGETELTDGVP